MKHPILAELREIWARKFCEQSSLAKPTVATKRQPYAAAALLIPMTTPLSFDLAGSRWPAPARRCRRMLSTASQRELISRPLDQFQMQEASSRLASNGA
jgi:hypothetical protein